MVTKSLASYDLEIDRINEWLFNNRGDDITDKESFGMFLRDEIFEKDKLGDLENKILDRAFKKYANTHGIVAERVVDKKKVRIRVQPRTRRAIKGTIKRQVVFIEPITFKRGTKLISAYRDVKTKRFAKDTMRKS